MSVRKRQASEAKYRRRIVSGKTPSAEALVVEHLYLLAVEMAESGYLAVTKHYSHTAYSLILIFMLANNSLMTYLWVFFLILFYF